jgi:hypothetical protein
MAENVIRPETPPASAPMPASIETTSLQSQAILVIHGIGLQQPFQPLDSFVNGLRARLQRDGKSVTTTHLLSGREEAFDNSIRFEVSESRGGTPNFRLDVYEFYWAPLAQGRASFAQVVRWLVATGFTPLRRVAFNISLLARRATTRGQLFREFARELWRLVYVPLGAVALAWFAANLVGQSIALAKQLPEALAQTLPSLMHLSGSVPAAFALIAAIAAIGLGLSIPEQIRDFWRLHKNAPPLTWNEAGRAASRAYHAENNIVTGVLKGAAAGAGMDVRSQWQAELRARILFLPLSFVGLLVAVAIVIWLSLPSPICIGPVCPAPVVHDLFGSLWDRHLATVVLLLLGAFVLKRVFVDYIADIALYTTVDENSAFFKTRAAILTEAARRVRFLLRERQYTSVAIAAHSLGSVIAYDVINWLRTEARLSPSNADEFAKLTTLITFGSPLNKVLYFFRTKTKVYETVRQHIIQELQGFRLLPDLLMQDQQIKDSGVTQIPDQLYWLNFYSPMDPISARLTFYGDVQERRRWYLIWGKCHVDYWHDRKFYREVLDALEKGRKKRLEVVPVSTQGVTPGETVDPASILIGTQKQIALITRLDNAQPGPGTLTQQTA